MSDLFAPTCWTFTHGINRIIRNSADWYKRSQCNDRVRERAEYDMPNLTRLPFFYQYDVGLCAYTSLMRIVGKFHEELFSDPNTATGLNKVSGNPWV